MTVSIELLQQITEAVKNRPPVIPERVRLESKPLAVTLNRDRIVYSNPRVTEEIDEGVGQGETVKYVKFIPMEEAGLVLMRRAKLGEDGAVPFSRSRSGRTGRLNLSAALAGFRLHFDGNRNLRCSFFTVDIPGDAENQKETVGVIQIKNPDRRRGARRQKQAPPPATN